MHVCMCVRCEYVNIYVCACMRVSVSGWCECVLYAYMSVCGI